MEDEGIAWPPGREGAPPSTTAEAKGILAAALRVLDPAAADAVLAERHWRKGVPSPRPHNAPPHPSRRGQRTTRTL